MVALLVAAVLAAPQPVCRISDERLTEVSGLAATGTGYVVVDDGSDDPDHRRIFFLNKRCAVVRTVAYPSRPRDTEDLAAAADGTVWVGDIGDNGESRSTIAYWKLAPGSTKPQLYRLSYPDGAHDAEALLLPSGGGPPLVVTKSIAGAAVYVPSGPLRAGETTPLRRAGGVRVPLTSTSNPFGLPGRLVITGGAVSPDGQRVTLRTYADAFEFDVPGGDVVSAVTQGTPRRTIPLPNEPQGESVAYTPDGSALLTVSEGAGPILSYPLGREPAAPPAEESTAPAPEMSSAAPRPSAAAAPEALSRSRIPIGAVVAILIAAVVTLGVLIGRRRRR
ncbi:esterase-like activity of phytase family protein [Actinoplanes sp. TBRC 11911]|uniref:hypothetical protein n=1 Tax=Actinoplanes sp. TBRC 11911 TaxID=2729386 RepID=UPI00145E8B6F|nr:hypothetical protein [Actinoplanes sp. TBRC 11911]NMO52374.1 esterase-like activity of phytase family protein [Actinoplanes sp. TBRC 11911]